MFPALQLNLGGFGFKNDILRECLYTGLCFRSQNNSWWKCLVAMDPWPV